MIYSPRQLANKLQLIRTSNSWTQQEVAARAGVKQATISNFENDPDRCQLQTMFKIMQALEAHMQITQRSLSTNDLTESGVRESDPEDDW